MATTRSTNAAKPLLSREDLFDCSHINGDFDAISVTGSASSVLKVERYISPDRFCNYATLRCSVNSYSARRLGLEPTETEVNIQE